MALAVPDDGSSRGTADLVDACRVLLAEPCGRVTTPGLVDHVPAFPAQSSPAAADEGGLYADAVEEISLDEASEQTAVDVPVPRGALPELAVGVEEPGRTLETARTALAGHAARPFGAPEDREALPGIPAGKCAYRNAAEYLREYLRIPVITPGPGSSAPGRSCPPARSTGPSTCHRCSPCSPAPWHEERRTRRRWTTSSPR